jgi:hypothetical protein
MKPTKPTADKKYYYPEYQKEYYQRPEVKERKKEYYQRPEVKEYRKEYMKEYNQKPEVKERQKEYKLKELRCKHCDSIEVMIEYAKDNDNKDMAYEITKCTVCKKATVKKIRMADMKLRNLEHIFNIPSCPIGGNL